jgi:hypothetical protein
MADPELCTNHLDDYWAKVKETHERGGFGSLGYNY